MNERDCLDIFTGLGCFSIAARVNGVRTIAMCEREVRCRNFLLANWPGIPIAEEIKTFDATPYRGVWLVAGGPPCQPASLAGKRRGKDDTRWLWPQALRIVDEAKPTWILFENPPGIDGVGLDGVLAGLEGKGYEVQTLNIPACAVNSPQLRKRLWIVGHCETQPSRGLEQRRSRWQDIKSSRPSQNSTLAKRNGESGECRQFKPERGPQGRDADGRAFADGAVANGSQQPERMAQHATGAESWRDAREHPAGTNAGHELADLWREYRWIECGDGKYRRAPEPRICRLVDGIADDLLPKLERIINETAKNPRDSKKLRLLWKGDDAEAIRRWSVGRSISVQQAEVLLSLVREQQSGGDLAFDEGQEIPRKSLRGMRCRGSTGRSPHGRGPVQQFPIESEDALRFLSSQTSLADLATTPCCLSFVSGLADNGSYNGLLEALGNAIVWPVAARIIAAMINAEEWSAR